MEIIDAHCHIYPKKIANKAVNSIGKFYNIAIRRNGTCDDLIKLSNEYNISKMIVHSTATKPEQVPNINDFIIDSVKKYDKFIGFGTLHPYYNDLESEFNKIVNSGLKGIKIHPDFQEVNIDDKEMDKIYEIVADKLPILFHIGDIDKDFSNPVRLRKVIDRFPKLKPIAAHLGGFTVWTEALELFDKKNVWYDTCSSFYYLTDNTIKNIINKHGIDKIFFSTDYPMWNFDDEYKRLLSLKLKPSETEKILSGNIKEMLNLK